MSSKPNSQSYPNQARIYQIKIKGHLGSHWSEWLENLKITRDEDGNTLLIGSVVDDAALHGILKKVRDLGLPLISFNQMESGWEDR
jgi:hypothetical protein